MRLRIRIILDSVFCRPPQGRLAAALACAATLICGGGNAAAESGTYQTPEAFVAAAFPDREPAAGALWIRQPLRDAMTDILGHPPKPRIRYWRAGDRTAWVLEEIGKDRPITAGFVVSGGSLDGVRVLVFRESRGWEVKYPFFTDQFQGARLDPDHRLDKSVDGITGATLSVRAMTKMARLALLLDAHARDQAADLTASAH